MNRLAFQITAVIVFVALVTITLVVSVQFVRFGAEQQSLPADIRLQVAPVSILRPALVPSLEGNPQLMRIRPAVAANPNLSGQAFAGAVAGAITPGQTLPETVARFTLPAQPATDARTFGLIIQDFQTRRARLLLLSGAISVVLAILLGLLLARLISKPIERVSLAAAQLAQGGFSVRVALPQPRAAVPHETTQLAHAFNRMADTLERYERERRAMIADTAHELRTPLTIMRGRLEALEDGLADFDLSEVRNLHDQTLLLSRLVDDLRTLSLADAGRLSAQKEAVNLSTLVRGIVEGFSAQAHRKGIRLDYSAPPTLELLADADRLRQVVGNLLDNALKHTPEGGWVRLELSEQAHEVTIRVTDSGAGLAPGSEAQVFDRFYRAEPERQRASSGSGLGLSIVKTLVELHGGQIQARNRDGGGAEFTIGLPRA